MNGGKNDLRRAARTASFKASNRSRSIQLVIGHGRAKTDEKVFDGRQSGLPWPITRHSSEKALSGISIEADFLRR